MLGRTVADSRQLDGVPPLGGTILGRLSGCPPVGSQRFLIEPVPQGGGVVDAVVSVAGAFVFGDARNKSPLPVMEPTQRSGHILLDVVAAQPLSFQPLANFSGHAAPGKRIQHRVARICQHSDEELGQVTGKPSGVQSMISISNWLLGLISTGRRHGMG